MKSGDLDFSLTPDGTNLRLRVNGPLFALETVLSTADLLSLTEDLKRQADEILNGRRRAHE